MSDSDLHDELRELVSGFRAHLQQRARGGAFGAPATRSPRSLPADDAAHAEQAPTGSGETLQAIRDDLGDCARCKLQATRTNIVFGVGSPRAPLMFVGEAPGADEDRLGEPFVGKAGQLLDKMIAAMGWAREHVYIANTLKCRPPGNRDPEQDETEACQGFLHRQILSIAPRVIVTLGRPAAHLLLNTNAPISRLRGHWQSFEGIKVMPTFHPAYLLRDASKKREAWSDLKLVIQELEAQGVQSPNPARA